MVGRPSSSFPIALRCPNFWVTVATTTSTHITSPSLAFHGIEDGTLPQGGWSHIMSDPSRYLSSLLLSYQQQEDALTQAGTTVAQPDEGFQPLKTVLSALFGPDEHEKRFHIFSRDYVGRLQKASRLYLLRGLHRPLPPWGPSFRDNWTNPPLRLFQTFGRRWDE